MFARLLIGFGLSGCAATPAATPASPSTAPVESVAPSDVSVTRDEPSRSEPSRTDARADADATQPGEPARNDAAARDASIARAARTASTASTIEYETPLLDPPALARAARAACEASFASGRPLLLEFSAPWCEDCIVLQRVKAAAPLAGEIGNWELLPINIGGGFEHSPYMIAYKVNAIAKLVVVHPRSCADPPTVWTQLAARTLDGLGKRDAHAGVELAHWLEIERAHLSRPAGAR